MSVLLLVGTVHDSAIDLSLPRATSLVGSGGGLVSTPLVGVAVFLDDRSLLTW